MLGLVGAWGGEKRSSLPEQLGEGWDHFLM